MHFTRKGLTAPGIKLNVYLQKKARVSVEERALLLMLGTSAVRSVIKVLIGERQKPDKCAYDCLAI
jgi:hypothetical protein